MSSPPPVLCLAAFPARLCLFQALLGELLGTLLAFPSPCLGKGDGDWERDKVARMGILFPNLPTNCPVF